MHELLSAVPCRAVLLYGGKGLRAVGATHSHHNNSLPLDCGVVASEAFSHRGLVEKSLFVYDTPG